MLKTNWEFPYWCNELKRPYRCQRYLAHISPEEIVYLYERQYKLMPPPLNLRFFQYGLFEFLVTGKIKRWEEQEKRRLNKWFKITISKGKDIQYSGPFLSKDAAQTQDGHLIAQYPLQMELEKDVYPFTPFSDMIDGPEDYCALSLQLKWIEPPLSDFEEPFDLLDDLLDPGPRYFGNAIHKDDVIGQQREALVLSIIKS